MTLPSSSPARTQRRSSCCCSTGSAPRFSQGAILALEATQLEPSTAAFGRVIALAGRFAVPVRRAPQGLRFHLIHGEQDGVVPTRFSVEAAQALQALGGTVTLDLLPGLGHGIDARALGLVTGHVGDRS